MVGLLSAAVPVLLYLGAVAYVSWGFMNSAIIQKVSTVFGAPARVGAVRTDWLRNLKVENVAVEGPDKSTPVTADAVTLDWDLGPFLHERRIRSAMIQHPQIALRRSRAGAWNIHVKLPEESAYRIEQYIMREGNLSVEWPESGAAGLARVRLQALSGTYTSQGLLLPKPFSLYGVFDSLESISVNGSLGPGPNWVAAAHGGIKLEQDLAGVLEPPAGATPAAEKSIRGQVRYDISARNEPAGDRAELAQARARRALETAFSGQFILDNFNWPLTERLALSTPKKTLDMYGTASLDAGPDALATFSKLQLRVDGVGALSGAGRLPVEPELHATLSDVQGTIDAEPLNQIFYPNLWSEALSLKGSVKLSGLTARLPLSVGAPPFALTTQFSAAGARIAFKDLGELPLCDIAGTLEWPALRNVSLSVGDVGTAVFSLNDVCPAGDSFWLALAGGATVHRMRVNIGRFWESELGRRILTATFDTGKPVPSVGELPYILQGTLTGQELKLAIERDTGQPPPLVKRATRVSLEGLRLEGARITRWPFAFNLPAREFEGTLKVKATLAGDVVQTIGVNGSLLVPGQPGSAGTALEFEQSYAPQAGAGKAVGPIHITSLLFALEQLDRIFAVKSSTGLSGKGMLRVSDTVFDPATGDARGTIEADGVTLTVPVPRNVQEAILSVLKVTRLAAAAPLFDTEPTETLELENVNARCTAEIKAGHLTLKGRVEPVSVHAMLPSVGDRELVVLPRTDFELGMDLARSQGTRSYTLKLAFDDGTKLDLSLKEDLPRKGVEAAPGDAWKLHGTLASPIWGGVAAAFDVPFDLGQRQIGPVTATVKDVDLGKAGALLADAGIQQPAGHVRDLDLELKPYSWKALNPAKEWVASGTLDGVRLSTAATDVAQLTGVTRVTVKAESESTYVNAVVRLTSYEVLLNGGAFYIPPPAEGKTGRLGLRAKYFKREKSTEVKLELLEANLGEEVSLQTGGTLTLTGPNVTKMSLDDLKIRVPDLAQARQTFGPPNLKDRAPWFGDIGLAGAGRFKGRFAWDAAGAVALEGSFGLDNATLTLGQSASFTVRDVSGEVPVVLRAKHWGEEARKEDETPPPELRGELKLGALEYAGISAAPQKLELAATANSLAVATPLALKTPLGPAVIDGLALKNVLAADARAEIPFRVGISVELDRVLRENGIAIVGMEGLVLTGQPLACLLRRTSSSSLRGPWELVTAGSLRGPFFGGEIVLEKLNARGLFGPAPVSGGDVRLYDKEGIKITQLTEKNPRFGEFHIRANASLTGIEAASANLEGIQKFVLDVDSVDLKENEFWYDGRLAMAIAPDLMRAAFPRFLYSDEFLYGDQVKQLTFGVRKLGLRFTLVDGCLYGPAPKLPGDLLIEAYGAEGVGALFSKRLKQDVQGDAEHKRLWADVVKQFKRANVK